MHYDVSCFCFFACQVCKEAVVGDCRNRWFDKSISILVFKSGRLASHCDVSVRRDYDVQIVLVIENNVDLCNYSFICECHVLPWGIMKIIN